MSTIFTGPKEHTLIDFWRLVWQERPLTIVMVTNLTEGNKKKCEQYWPDSGSKAFGPFKITLTEQQDFAGYTIRTMQVTVSIHRHYQHTYVANSVAIYSWRTQQPELSQ